ncbi:MAG: aminotransferase class IV [Clostridia bacterium]
MNPIRLDRGVQFGIGVFETIAVWDHKAVFLPFHLDRLEKGMDTLGIRNKEYHRDTVLEKISDIEKLFDRIAVKIMVSEENFIVKLRKIPYTQKDYEKGFHICFSEVLRNETSPMTYLKTVNCADLILEKGKAKERGFDEPVFLNTRGNVTEGAVSNIFCVKDGKIRTPSLSCGLLNGTVRHYLLTVFREIEETVLTKEDVLSADEIFLTNSLMGIMPVSAVEDRVLSSREKGDFLKNQYFRFIRDL